MRVYENGCIMSANHERQYTMTQMPRPPFQQHNPPQPPPTPPEPEYRFRWVLFVGVPLTIIIFIWFIRGIRLNTDFAGIMEALNIQHDGHYIRLTCLAITLIAMILITKLFKK